MTKMIARLTATRWTSQDDTVTERLDELAIQRLRPICQPVSVCSRRVHAA